MTDTQSQDQAPEAPAEDLRSALQKREEAEAAVHAGRTKAERIAHELDAIIKELRHQAAHNAPAAPGHIQRLEAVRKLLG